ncbi:MAG: hypothetical protein WA268_09045 [Xanthobacteraceae bacterium]
MNDEAATTVSSVSSCDAKLDTTAGSALHVVPRALERRRLAPFSPLVHYIAAISLTILPLVIAGEITREYSGASMTAPSGSIKMPFFYDLPTLCMYLVSLPCLLILTVTDDQLLRHALDRVQIDGIVKISKANGTALAERWCRYFRRTNVAAQVIGLLAGTAVVYFDVRQAVAVDIGSWVAPSKHIGLNGYVFFYCNFLFAFVASIYVIRSILLGILLWDVVTHADLHILPLHPDKAGGLRPVGRLGLRNQYAITLVGLNIGLGVFVSVLFLKNWNLGPDMVIATIACLLVGPLMFAWPLLPFRDAMRKNKAQVMSGAASGMRADEL